MKTKSKILHPNKLVQQHDEYLIDKSLVNRVKSAKTTIKNSNTFFETRLKSRNKSRAVTSGVKFSDNDTDTLDFEKNYKLNICGMDENLLNYLKDLSKNIENQEDIGNKDGEKKRGFKISDYEHQLQNIKAQTADSGMNKKDSGRNVKTQFPTEKISSKKKEVFQSEMKSYGMNFDQEVYFDDDETEENWRNSEKRENDRYKKIDEIPKKTNIVEDVSHCNFESPEIQITSKGLLRNSTYKIEKDNNELEENSTYK